MALLLDPLANLPLEGLSSTFSEWGGWGLFAWAFSEAVFFPVPPDLGLLFLAERSPETYVALAAIATAGSGIGAVAGWWVGRLFRDPLEKKLGHTKAFRVAKRQLLRHGDVAILLAGFTPIPYKVFCVMSGMFGVSKRTLFIFSLMGRGARFFLVAWVAAKYGEGGKGFWWTPAGIVWILGVTALVVGVGLFREVRAKRARGRGLDGPMGPEGGE